MKPKNHIFLALSFALLAGCSPQGKNETTAKEKEYNPTIYKIIKAHGGIENWNKQHTLSFTMGNQKQTIDLKSRDIKITAPGFSMGSKNGMVWIKQDSGQFKGSPRFYSSLMFYFHTMPFVFADDGINYDEVPDKEIEGTEYKGIRMSFNKNVGDAPNDQYILYYHPDTYRMEWLAYNSTFRTQKKSNDFNMIHYKTWKESNGFLLPVELQWYSYKGDTLGSPQGDPKVFTNTTVSENKMGNGFFDIPKGAELDSAGVK